MHVAICMLGAYGPLTYYRLLLAPPYCETSSYTYDEAHYNP